MPTDKSTAPPASQGRRSARLAGEPAIPTGQVKKRPAESSTNGDAKKTKTASATIATATKTKATASKSTSKKGTTSTTNGNGKTKTNGTSKAAAAIDEEEAEASGSAEPETGGRAILKMGDVLPDITVQDHTGEDVDVSSLTEENGAILFLYPKADTPGCTTQACGYRDSYDEITVYGYNTYGLSKDKPAAQQKWVTKKNLNYKLLCDPDSELIKRLGAFVRPNNVKRSHFIFEKGSGKLVDIAIGVKPADDPKNVLKFLAKHQRKTKNGNWAAGRPMRE